MMNYWLLDATATIPEEDVRGWCPVQGTVEEENLEPVPGLLMIADKPPGEALGVFHPDGADAVNTWVRENDEYLQMVFADVRS